MGFQYSAMLFCNNRTVGLILNQQFFSHLIIYSHILLYNIMRNQWSLYSSYDLFLVSYMINTIFCIFLQCTTYSSQSQGSTKIAFSFLSSDPAFTDDSIYFLLHINIYPRAVNHFQKQILIINNLKTLRFFCNMFLLHLNLSIWLKILIKMRKR